MIYDVLVARFDILLWISISDHVERLLQGINYYKIFWLLLSSLNRYLLTFVMKFVEFLFDIKMAVNSYFFFQINFHLFH